MKRFTLFCKILSKLRFSVVAFVTLSGFKESSPFMNFIKVASLHCSVMLTKKKRRSKEKRFSSRSNLFRMKIRKASWKKKWKRVEASEKMNSSKRCFSLIQSSDMLQQSAATLSEEQHVKISSQSSAKQKKNKHRLDCNCKLTSTTCFLCADRRLT